MNNMYLDHQMNIRSKVVNVFALSLFVAFIGVFVGVFVPASLFGPLSVLELVILFIAFFARKKGTIGYPFLYFFTFLSGITLNPIVAHYTTKMGGTMVGVAFLTTAVVFTALGMIGSRTNRNLSFMGGTLLSALLALILLCIINFFIPLGGAGYWVITIVGVMIFSAYTIYDFNMMKQYELEEEDVPLMALNLYLDFINLFINILRIFGGRN